MESIKNNDITETGIPEPDPRHTEQYEENESTDTKNESEDDWEGIDGTNLTDGAKTFCEIMVEQSIHVEEMLDPIKRKKHKRPNRIGRFLKRRWKDMMIIGIILGMTVCLDYYTSRVIEAIWCMDHTLILSPTIPVLLLIVTEITFAVSTLWQGWNYDNRKKLFILFAAIIPGLTVFGIITYLGILLIKPGIELSGDWIPDSVNGPVILFLVVGLSGTVAAAVMLRIERSLLSKRTFRKLCAFRLALHLDLRHNRRNLYDACIIRRKDTHKMYVQREEDRYLHTIITGATGTAKTSSALLPMIKKDLLKRCAILKKIREIMWKGVESGRYRVTKHISDSEFTLDAFEPLGRKNVREFEKLKKKYRICGLTVIGPDPSLSDQVYDMCAEFGIPCNRVDPVYAKGSRGQLKEGSVGYNPLYIPPETPEWLVWILVLERAILTADIIQEISMMTGKEERYFTSVNRSVTVAVTICLCLTFKAFKGRQANLMDVRQILDDFDRIEPYFKKLEKLNAKTNDNRYGFILDFIREDMLYGEDRKKIRQHATGIKLIFDEVLAHPAIARALCPPDNQTLNMDRMLAEGQVTAINFALSLGSTNAKWFGLIMLLSFFKAVLRRDGAQGTSELPHFLIVDELAVIATPELNTAVSLFRKYKVAFVGALQSLTQFDENEHTKALKNTLLTGCGTSIVFGRQGVEEMRRYAELSGRDWLLDDPEPVTSSTTLGRSGVSTTRTYSDGARYEDRITPTEMRYMDFQQVAVFSVCNGVAMVPFMGYTQFMDDKMPAKTRKHDWAKHFVGTIADHPTDIESEDTIGVDIDEDLEKPGKDDNGVDNFHTATDQKTCSKNDGSVLF